MSKIFRLPELNLEVEIGKFARQADGSAWVKVGGNVVLSTAVAAKAASNFLGFFPLTVEYRERTSAAGKIPGGYMKREGRLPDGEVLISRLIDRSIRPFFPKNFFSEVQVLSSVYSSDGSFPTAVMAIIGSSISLMLSNIPFNGPIGAVQINLVNGEWKFNSSYENAFTSDSSIMVVGTKDGICMVEGNCNNLLEEKLVELLAQAETHIKTQVEWQEEICKELVVAKNERVSSIDWPLWREKVLESFTPEVLEPLFGKAKIDRSNAMSELKENVMKRFAADVEAGTVANSVINYLFEESMSETLPNLMIKKNIRIDGRKFDEVRDIFTEVGLLPCSHGSSVFQRGETQALASITLGTGQDAQKVDTLLGGTQERFFMLHYNMPPFATGEAKPMRGPGRREIGHGYLAESSFANVLPTTDEFPYTIRSLVDVLESNGSSSMATVCSTTMALMDAGVPIKSMVSGIAMGMLQDSSGNLQVITDILGLEDSYGLMDFKVTGTDVGIMSFQLDIKSKIALPRTLLSKALDQAKTARLHILNEMKKVMTKPRESISDLAPRVSMIKIAVDKIGMIIGPGGKNIKEIIAQTGTQIDIEDDGTVKIYSKDATSTQKAVDWIKMIAGDIEVDSVHNGIVKRIIEFGIFVELVPGKEGLVHISTIAKSRQRTLMDDIKIGDRLTVKVTAYDSDTGRIRLIAPSLER